ncbi:Sulfotransferase family cytosolic 1B member 1 [Eumeta japonica]|uniref:Sulfotransferase family cytosolic 1B member 1 n=1 Tax=Eumeta variegata TaxID=151549 RepID=A0A4C1UQ94_EUMVA|nr:Sulfotransferase family cytosolic 1B member 1 [Eumeta japonica]
MAAVKPVIVQDLEPEKEELLIKRFLGQRDGYAYFGEQKYLLPKPYEEHVDGIRCMPLRKDDVWVATFPRSGNGRHVFPSFLPKGAMDDPLFEEIGTGMLMDYKELVDKPSPRFIKTHLPMSLLSPQLLDTSRVVYVARDPRDVAVSYYHHNKLLKIHDFSGDFKDYWKLFINDLVYWAPFFEHLREAWEQRNHPNMLFLFYEEMYKDLPGVVRRVAKFFEKEYSDEQIQKLCEHLKIDKMKKNKSVHPEWLQASPLVQEGAESFIRKGKAGGWQEYFDEEMSAEAEKWMQENLKKTDMRFPEV